MACRRSYGRALYERRGGPGLAERLRASLGNDLFWNPSNLGVQGGLLTATDHSQTRWHDTLTALMPSADEAQRLMMSPGTPLLIYTRAGYDAEGGPVRYMVSRMAADRVEVSYDLNTDD